MKKMRRNIISICLIFSMIAGAVFAERGVFADKMSEAEAQKKELQQERKELKDMLSDLENDKADIFAYIQKLDKKLDNVASKLEKTEEKIKKKKKNIKKLEKKIGVAETEINNQYENMKLRIKYMYEKGNDDYLDILLASGSLSDMLNRTEYIEKISEYDSKLLDNFILAKNELTQKKEELELEKANLTEQANLLQEKKAALKVLEEKKKEEIIKYNANIEATQNALDENKNELERQEKIIEDELLKEQRRIAEEERRRQELLQQQQAGQQGNTQVQPQVSVTGFIWPLAISGTVTSEFGPRNSPTAGASSNHQGIDIGAASGTAILAANSGTVVTAKYNSAAGNYVMINHGGGVFTVYMHASALLVSEGQTVTKGQTIAKVGSTGVSTGPHLHFGVSVNGSYVNPRNYVSP